MSDVRYNPNDPLDNTRVWQGISHYELNGHLERLVWVLKHERSCDVFTQVCYMCEKVWNWPHVDREVIKIKEQPR